MNNMVTMGNTGGDAEDRQLIEKYRKKYAGMVAANAQQEGLQQGVDEAHIAAVQLAEDKRRLEEMRTSREAKPDAGAEAAAAVPTVSGLNGDFKLCMNCSGQGKVKEFYGFREMTKHCEYCDGDGVTVDGKPRSAANPSVRQSQRHDAAADLDHATPEEKAKAKLEKTISKLEGQVSTYEFELCDTEERLVQAEDATERQLLRDLVEQLQARIAKLQAKLEGKRAEVKYIPANFEKLTLEEAADEGGNKENATP